MIEEVQSELEGSVTLFEAFHLVVRLDELAVSLQNSRAGVIGWAELKVVAGVGGAVK